MRATESSCIAPSWTSGTICVGGFPDQEGAEKGTEGVRRIGREVARMSVLGHTPDQIMIYFYCFLLLIFSFSYSIWIFLRIFDAIFSLLLTPGVYFLLIFL